MNIILKKDGFFKRTGNITPRGKHKNIFIIIFNLPKLATIHSLLNHLLVISRLNDI